MTIIVILGLTPTILIGDSVQIRKHGINSVGCNASTYERIYLRSPENTEIPAFNIVLTPIVNKCFPNSITLVNISATGSRSLKSV